jgi:hypothetical protein
METMKILALLTMLMSCAVLGGCCAAPYGCAGPLDVLKLTGETIVGTANSAAEKIKEAGFEKRIRQEYEQDVEACLLVCDDSGYYWSTRDRKTLRLNAAEKIIARKMLPQASPRQQAMRFVALAKVAGYHARNGLNPETMNRETMNEYFNEIIELGKSDEMWRFFVDTREERASLRTKRNSILLKYDHSSINDNDWNLAREILYGLKMIMTKRYETLPHVAVLDEALDCEAYELFRKVSMYIGAMTDEDSLGMAVSYCQDAQPGWATEAIKAGRKRLFERDILAKFFFDGDSDNRAANAPKIIKQFSGASTPRDKAILFAAYKIMCRIPYPDGITEMDIKYCRNMVRLGLSSEIWRYLASDKMIIKRPRLYSGDVLSARRIREFLKVSLPDYAIQMNSLYHVQHVLTRLVTLKHITLIVEANDPNLPWSCDTASFEKVLILLGTYNSSEGTYAHRYTDPAMAKREAVNKCESAKQGMVDVGDNELEKARKTVQHLSSKTWAP